MSCTGQNRAFAKTSSFQLGPPALSPSSLRPPLCGRNSCPRLLFLCPGRQRPGCSGLSARPFHVFIRAGGQAGCPCARGGCPIYGTRCPRLVYTGRSRRENAAIPAPISARPETARASAPHMGQLSPATSSFGANKVSGSIYLSLIHI